MTEADGYSAVVAAAAKVACSPIVDRPVREKAQEFISTEIDRWSDGPDFADDAEDDPSGE